jgi:methyltransferase-like protein
MSYAVSYDDLEYPSLPLAQTHPERAATAATLLGLQPAPVDRCRVLELGCASGGNLLPLSIALPGSEFLGVDLSARQIAQGQGVIAALQQGNITLQQADLLALAATPGALGQYDYILCHGVYSWVPAAVRQAILTICQRHLLPHGIAYISYNTLPGFYRRQPLRDMMLFHLAQTARQRGAAPPPAAAVRESRALIDLMYKACADRKDSWAHSLAEEAALLRSVPDGYVFHDHLEADNSPFYFHEFIKAASSHGLQYLSEAVPLPGPETLPAALQQMLQPLRGDPLVIEQYLDFARNQSLRCTLLCRAELPLVRELLPRRLVQMAAGCASWPTAERRPTTAEIRSAAGIRFSSPAGPVMVHDAPTKAVLMALCERDPQALGFAALADAASDRLGRQLADDALAEILLSGYRAGILRLHVQPPRFALAVSERPLASPLSRLQAQEQSQVANLRHQVTELSPLEQQVLVLLDGTRDRAALAEALLQKVRSGALAVDGGKRAAADADADEPLLRQKLAKQIESTLATLARCALLVS